MLYSEYSSLQPFMMLHALGEASYLRVITVIRPSPTKCSLVACLGIFQNKTCWPPFVHLVQSALSGLEKKALVFPRGTCMLYLIMNVKWGTFCPPALKISEVVLDHGNSSFFLKKQKKSAWNRIGSDMKASFPLFFSGTSRSRLREWDTRKSRSSLGPFPTRPLSAVHPRT